jgi:hypothetical protein
MLNRFGHIDYVVLKLVAVRQSNISQNRAAIKTGGTPA